MRWERFNSDKICVVTYARIQGKQALVSHFRRSRLMLKHEKYRPLIFNDYGRPETIPINRSAPIPHPSSARSLMNHGSNMPVARSGVYQRGPGPGVGPMMHPGSMSQYQLMSMMNAGFNMCAPQAE